MTSRLMRIKQNRTVHKIPVFIVKDEYGVLFILQRIKERRQHTMDKEKKEEILREAHERAKAAVTRKEKSILRTVEEPILPALCKIIFIGMLVLTAAMLLVDINAFIRYDSHLGVLHLYRNVVMTGLGSWGMFSVLLILCCFFGMKQAEKRFWKKRKAGGIVDETPEDRERSQRAIRKLLNPFILYMKTSLIGLLLWVILLVVYLFLSK